MRKILIPLSLMLVIGFSLNSGAASGENVFSQERFSINFRNTSLTDALTLIAGKGHLKLTLDEKISGKVNYAIRNSTLEEALQQITETNGLEYQIDGHHLNIFKRAAGVASASTASRHVAQEEPEMPATAARPDNGNEAEGLTYRSVSVKFANAHDLSGSLQRNLRPGETIIADDANNVMLLFSSLATYKQVKTFIELYDKRPSQILIEAEIVETTRSFAQDLGVSFGDMNATTGNAPTAGVINPSQSDPSLVIRGLLGSINGRLLEARLLAAETRGDAKIVSRPKVFALNNKKATIHSGITYNIKTLSAVTTAGTTGSTSTPTAVTGGIVSIASGLQLDVTPTVVGEGLVRMEVKVVNSEPDAANSVDGIPGINDNSADTSILIRTGETATMAGLMKNKKSESVTGVPWISRVPVIGWLFSSRQKSDQTSELMIFLTPHVLDNAEAPPARAAASVAAPAEKIGK